MTTRAPKGGFLNYSTVIDPAKSAGECIAILAAHGATAIGITYNAGVPTGISFVIGTAWGPFSYSLPVNVAGTHKALLAAWRAGRIRQGFATEEQARRTGWRVLKDWLEIQIALVESGVADFAQVMLPYVQVGDDGETAWQRWADTQRKALTEGNPE